MRIFNGSRLLPVVYTLLVWRTGGNERGAEPLLGTGGVAVILGFDRNNDSGSARSCVRVTSLLCDLFLLRVLGWNGGVGAALTGFFLSRKVILGKGVTICGRGENKDESIALMSCWMRPNQAFSISDAALEYRALEPRGVNFVSFSSLR